MHSGFFFSFASMYGQNEFKIRLTWTESQNLGCWSNRELFHKESLFSCFSDTFHNGIFIAVEKRANVEIRHGFKMIYFMHFHSLMRYNFKVQCFFKVVSKWNVLWTVAQFYAFCRFSAQNLVSAKCVIEFDILSGDLYSYHCALMSEFYLIFTNLIIKRVSFVERGLQKP